MGSEHPAGDDPGVTAAEEIGAEHDRRRDGRDVVEAEEHREHRDRNVVVDDRKEEQAETSERVVGEEQASWVDPVGEPTAHQRADEVEHPHHREPVRCRHLAEAVIGRVGDEVLADQPVARPTAHQEGSGQQPELRSANRAAHDPGVGHR